MSRISVIQCPPQLHAEKKSSGKFRIPRLSYHATSHVLINVNITLRIREPGKGDKKMRPKVVGQEQS